MEGRSLVNNFLTHPKPPAIMPDMSSLMREILVVDGVNVNVNDNPVPGLRWVLFV